MRTKKLQNQINGEEIKLVYRIDSMFYDNGVKLIIVWKILGGELRDSILSYIKVKKYAFNMEFVKNLASNKFYLDEVKQEISVGRANQYKMGDIWMGGKVVLHGEKYMIDFNLTFDEIPKPISSSREIYNWNDKVRRSLPVDLKQEHGWELYKADSFQINSNLEKRIDYVYINSHELARFYWLGRTSRLAKFMLSTSDGFGEYFNLEKSTPNKSITSDTKIEIYLTKEGDELWDAEILLLMLYYYDASFREYRNQISASAHEAFKTNKKYTLSKSFPYSDDNTLVFKGLYFWFTEKQKSITSNYKKVVVAVLLRLHKCHYGMRFTDKDVDVYGSDNAKRKILDPSLPKSERKKPKRQVSGFDESEDDEKRGPSDEVVHPTSSRGAVRDTFHGFQTINRKEVPEEKAAPKDRQAPTKTKSNSVNEAGELDDDTRNVNEDPGTEFISIYNWIEMLISTSQKDEFKSLNLLKYKEKWDLKIAGKNSIRDIRFEGRKKRFCILFVTYVKDGERFTGLILEPITKSKEDKGRMLFVTGMSETFNSLLNLIEIGYPIIDMVQASPDKWVKDSHNDYFYKSSFNENSLTSIYTAFRMNTGSESEALETLAKNVLTRIINHFKLFIQT